MENLFPYLGTCFIVMSIGWVISAVILAWSWGKVLQSLAVWIRHDAPALTEAMAKVLEASSEVPGLLEREEDSDGWKS